MAHQIKSPTDRFEETLIALILGSMTLVTFANVVARYGFNSNILWAVEFTVFLFAWMVLLGASYAVKIGAHIGVDAILNLVSPGVRKVMSLIAVCVCIAFSLLLLKGSWDYWANFANLPGTEGRWFPTGFEDKFRGKAWYETDDIPMPAILSWMEGAFNDGDEYEKLPRLIPYMIMPISMALLVFRFIQAAFRLLRGDITMIIVSHEAEDQIEDAAQYVKDNA
ncbi:MAG: TRAP transporter small permease [Amylibacter sp.]|jgi:C4-dicarboxylate transporter, DctQ subunit|nr:TRAP transporter small permease [Amylibacter sp.]